jgi:hypothetical protein
VWRKQNTGNCFEIVMLFSFRVWFVVSLEPNVEKLYVMTAVCGSGASRLERRGTRGVDGGGRTSPGMVHGWMDPYLSLLPDETSNTHRRVLRLTQSLYYENSH